MIILRTSLLISLSLWGVTSVYAEEQTQKVISGWIEYIRVEGHEHMVKAKFDTGAKTSSIHAINLEQFEKADKRWVRFDLKLPDGEQQDQLIPMERPVVRTVKIKNHDGNHDRRPVIKLQVCFNGQWQETQFNLVDRSEYIYPVLIGRRFLAETTIVDSSKTYLTQPECEVSE